MKEWENPSIKWKLRIKKLIYMLCFEFLCLIDQRIKTGSGLDGVVESFRDMSYIVIAILVLSHYQLQDFRKYWFLYVEWVIFSIIGGILFVWKGEAVAMFPSNRIVLAVNLLLWGIAIIQTLVRIIAEKRRLDFIHKPFACIWLLMMADMCILRGDIYWPEAYLIAYGTFYLTDYSEEERELLFQGMLNGILLGFFLMQGWCFVFRPYDIIRYSGVYSNSNHNVVFYLIVLVAIFTKLLYAYRSHDSEEKASKIGRIFLRVSVRIWYWFLAGAVLDFIVLTIGRTGSLDAVESRGAAVVSVWPRHAEEWRDDHIVLLPDVSGGL